MSHSDAAPHPRVPQELVEKAIDHLHSVADALGACCLVNKTWVPGSRYHLFYKAGIVNDTQLYAWMNIFPYPASHVAESVRRLHITHPRMLGDVSKFSLKQFHNAGYSSLGDLPGSSLGVPWMTNILLLPIFVRSVHLCLERICAWDISALFQRFRYLGNLSLFYHTICPQRRVDNMIALESSPKFRGELNCLTNNDLAFFTTLLGNLPNGVHFTRANASVPWEEPQFVNKLLRSLAHTLMSLNIETNSRG